MQCVVGNIPAGKTGARHPEQESVCLTIKGRTGIVLLLKPCASEGFEQLHDALCASVPAAMRGQVSSICSDSAVNLISQPDVLTGSFPRLQCVTEDPVHVKVRLEKCSGEKPNQVSVLAHGLCMQLFNKPKNFLPNEKFR